MPKALRGLGLPLGTRKPLTNILPPAPLECRGRTERATSMPDVAWDLRREDAAQREPLGSTKEPPPACQHFLIYISVRCSSLHPSRGRRHREAVVALSSLTPCSAALAGADVAPKTLDTNVWVRSLGSKVCQGSRQVWAAAQPQCRELPSHPLRGRGWSGAAARAWHSLGHAANAQLLGMPRSGEGLRVSLKKRLPKYEAHPGWGRFSRGQAAVPGLPPPARRASPWDRSPPQHGGVRDQERRGEEGLPQTSLSASCLALAFRRADAGPFGDLLGRVQGTPLPFPFLLPLPLSLPGLQPHRDEQSSTEETSNGPSPPVPTSTFLPLCQFLSHIPPSPQAPTAISFPLPQLPGPSPSHCPSSAARSKPARKKPGVVPLSIPRVFIPEGPRGARLPRSEAEPGEAARVVP